MNSNKNKTIIKESKEKISWYIIDAREYKLGRLSSKVAYLLKNKNNIYYIPHKQGQSKIIIINSKQIQITGNKSTQKTYKRHSGRPGGLKIEVFEKLQKRIPNRILEHAIKGMLPKNSLGRQLMKNIKIYPDNLHPHTNHQPIKLNID
uniref:Large ribosomal subunit protein uL13c n=1 Tax=Symphyocladiella dendroidea TaxID=2506487 RepID=A0A1Z1M7X4_9FLOR|nr:ribosomal protein L13 [Symphyocladiella dendroidea]ARW61931.1 ribosomal protein L13 [Symphyocladiella dendroidea]